MDIYESLVRDYSHWSSPWAIGAKWTLVMTLGWIANGMLQRCNPRWRVLSWRCVGLAMLLIPALHFLAPPLLQATAIQPSVSVVELSTVQGIEAGASDSSTVGQQAGAELGALVQAPSSLVPIFSTSLLWCVLAAGSALFLLRLAIGWFRIQRVLKEAVPASEAARGILQRVATDFGIHVPLEVRVSSSASAPTLSGVSKPILLIPQRLEESADELPAIFAHELSHVRSSDVVWNLVLHSIASVLWFHPLAWLMRSAHGAACESVSDAVAATYVGSVPKYCSVLARVAVHAHAPPRLSLGMARSSSVSRRIRALQSRVFASQLQPRHARMLLVMVLVGVVCLGSLKAVTVADVIEEAPTPGTLVTQEGDAQGQGVKGKSSAPSMAHLFTEDTRQAVEGSLKLLASRQGQDGAFGGPKLGDQRVAITAICGLAFLCDDMRTGGNSHEEIVERAREFILTQQQDNGSISGGSSLLYIHAYALQFLAEVQIVAPTPETNAALVKAVALTVKAQNRHDGWRYTPNSPDADSSATACQLVALTAARRAGVAVPQENIDRAVKYLLSCQVEDGGFTYIAGTPATSGLPRTAAVMAALLSAIETDKEELASGMSYLAKHASDGAPGGAHFYYGEYYRGRVMLQAGAELFQQWYETQQENLLHAQQDDHSWPHAMGSEYSTASACIALLSPYWTVRELTQ